jgi:hypothetical protein
MRKARIACRHNSSVGEMEPEDCLWTWPREALIKMNERFAKALARERQDPNLEHGRPGGRKKF